jgi:hypothetical protein
VTPKQVTPVHCVGPSTVIHSKTEYFRACDDELLPCPEDCNGRHWVRVELSAILIKYAFKISIQFWSRRDNSVVPLA